MGFFEENKTVKKVSNSLWCERYRPNTLEEYVGNTHLKEKIQGYLETGDIPHLLLFGKAGTGKTSLAKLIVNTIECDYIIINASDENNVDTVRTKLKGFASTVGFKDYKIVILDECLDENTLVSVMRNGDEFKLPIKSLDDKTDLVKSWNVDKSEIQWRPFYHWNIGVRDVYEIELENGEIVVCTEEHKWYVLDKNDNMIVVKTKDLHKYNYILSPQ